MIICHRINTVAGLAAVPRHFGVEVDVRHDARSGRLYLSHDPVSAPAQAEDLEHYLSTFQHAFIIFNIKEAGTEQTCIDLANKYGIPRSSYFLLDVEFPYLYRACGFRDRAAIRGGSVDRDRFVHEIAVRYSEAEPLAQAQALCGLVDWVWIDTNTTLPIDAESDRALADFRRCLVCPERWGRPQDIEAYAARLRDLGFALDAVMTALPHAARWERAGLFRSNAPASFPSQKPRAAAATRATP